MMYVRTRFAVQLKLDLVYLHYESSYVYDVTTVFLSTGFWSPHLDSTLTCFYFVNCFYFFGLFVSYFKGELLIYKLMLASSVI